VVDEIASILESGAYRAHESAGAMSF
jgi:hypothetical protein